MTRIELPGEKRVGHLTLLREPRSISPKEFNTLSFAERLEIVQRTTGADKYRLLVEADDGAALARTLPAQEVFSLIKEVGMEDAGDLLAITSTEQLTAFIDLDCWRGDSFDEKAGLNWLTMLMECGEEKVLTTLDEMDYGLLVLWLKKHVDVTGPDEYEEEDHLKERLANDRIYDIEIKDSETDKLLTSLFELLKKENRDFYLRLMEGLCWELDTELEEGVYRFRNSRLSDLGFPEPNEAFGVYSWIDPKSYDPSETRRFPVETGETGVAAPDFVLSTVIPENLLGQLLDRGLDNDRLWELTFLVNKIMIADRVDPGDREAMTVSATTLYRYVNIALEHLSGGDVDEAASAYQEAYLEHLFRLGFSLTLRLQWRAKKVKASSIAPYLDPLFQDFVQALAQRKPQFFEGVEEPAAGQARPFVTLEDVHCAEHWMEHLEAQQHFFEEALPFSMAAPELVDLEGCIPDAAEGLKLSDFFLTALANKLLGREFAPHPVPLEELPVLHEKISRNGRLDADFRKKTVQWADALVDSAGDFVDFSLDVWHKEFCALKPEQLDPRFIGGLIVKVT